MTATYKTKQGAALIRERYEQLLAEIPIATERLTIPTTLGETFVLACGPREAPPLLLFHGSGGNAAAWWHELPVWSNAFRVYAIDMIGEPGLSAPVRPPLTSEAHALWLDEVMSGLALKRASIVGISLGGWLALDYATRRPDRVERLALLCPGGLGKQKSSFLFIAIPLAMLGAWGRRKSLEMVAGAPTEEDLRGANLLAYTSLIFAHFNPRMEPLPRFGPERLRHLTMPVMLTVGGRDVMFDSRESRRKLEACVRSLVVRFLPDGRHGLRGQADCILSFLTD